MIKARGKNFQKYVYDKLHASLNQSINVLMLKSLIKLTESLWLDLVRICFSIHKQIF